MDRGAPPEVITRTPQQSRIQNVQRCLPKKLSPSTELVSVGYTPVGPLYCNNFLHQGGTIPRHSRADSQPTQTRAASCKAACDRTPVTLLVALTLRPSFSLAGSSCAVSPTRLCVLAPHVETLVDGPTRGMREIRWDCACVVFIVVIVEGGSGRQGSMGRCSSV
jgi:hypothetical protein